MINSSYVAGFFDGEGCVWICKRKIKAISHPNPYSFQMYVSISNTNKEVCEAFYQKFGGFLRFRYSENDKKKGWKPQSQWVCASLQAEKFLKLILPYSIVKREHIKVALEFQKRKRIRQTKTLKVLERDKHGRIRKSLGWLRTPEQYEFENSCYEKMKVLNKRGL